MFDYLLSQSACFVSNAPLRVSAERAGENLPAFDCSGFACFMQFFPAPVKLNEAWKIWFFDMVFRTEKRNFSEDELYVSADFSFLPQAHRLIPLSVLLKYFCSINLM